MSKSPPKRPSIAPRRRRTLLFVCSLITFTAVLTTGYLLTPAHAHFRMFHDESSFNKVMSNQVPQATLTDIQSLLGSGVPVAEQTRQQLLVTTRDFRQQTPASYPDGTVADDQFIAYNLGSHTTYLQFRNGKIVNFNPREYDAPFELKAISL